MGNNNNSEAKTEARPQGPPPATVSPPQDRPADAKAQTAPPRPRPNLAQGIHLPGMAPRQPGPPPRPQGTPPRRPRRPAPPPETEYQDEYEDELDPRTPMRQRVHGRQPVRGIGAPQALDQRQVVGSANKALEQYQRDPDSVDPTFVNLMLLQAMCSYGDQVTNLRSELARLRKAVTDMAGERAADEGESERPRGRAARVTKIQDRRGGGAAPRGRGRGLRGRRTG